MVPSCTRRGLLKSFKGIFKQLLSRDPGGCLSYGLDKDMTKLLEKLLNDVTFQFRNVEELRNQSLFVKFNMAVSRAYKIVEKTDEESSIVTQLFDIAAEATNIRLSLFTDLFHQAFKKLKFLESTFELLQQFEIQLVEPSCDSYLLFPGDMHQWQIRCLRCNNKISKLANLNLTLKMVPITILHHLSLATSDTDSYYIPVLFSSHERFKESRDMFYNDRMDRVCPCCQKFRYTKT